MINVSVEFDHLNDAGPDLSAVMTRMLLDDGMQAQVKILAADENDPQPAFLVKYREEVKGIVFNPANVDLARSSGVLGLYLRNTADAFTRLFAETDRQRRDVEEALRKRIIRQQPAFRPPRDPDQDTRRAWRCISQDPQKWALGWILGGGIFGSIGLVTREKSGMWHWQAFSEDGRYYGVAQSPSRVTAMEDAGEWLRKAGVEVTWTIPR